MVSIHHIGFATHISRLEQHSDSRHHQQGALMPREVPIDHPPIDGEPRRERAVHLLEFSKASVKLEVRHHHDFILENGVSPLIGLAPTIPLSPILFVGRSSPRIAPDVTEI